MPMQKKIFVVGNPIVEEDNVAVKVARLLRKKTSGVLFEEIDSVDSIKEFPETAVFMDAVKGLEKVCVINDLEKLCGSDVFSLHDLDAAFQLKLFKKMGKIKKIRIIAIPQLMEAKKAGEEVVALLSKEKIF